MTSPSGEKEKTDQSKGRRSKPEEESPAESSEAKAANTNPVVDESAPDLERLRLQVWRSRRRRVKLMGRLFLTGGLAALVAGYFSGYFGLELVSAVMIPLGVFFTISGNEPYIKSSLAERSVISAMQVLQEALKLNSDRGHAVFIPTKGSDRDVRMFIPAEDSPDGAVTEVGTAGHFYTPLGHELFASYLQELGGKTEKNLPLLLDQLRRVMTSGLELVEDVRFDVNQSAIEVRIRNATFAAIGRHPGLVEDVYKRAGCPVTNSIAEWISYGMNATVRWLDAQVDPVSRRATVRLSLVQEKRA